MKQFTVTVSPEQIKQVVEYLETNQDLSVIDQDKLIQVILQSVANELAYTVESEMCDDGGNAFVGDVFSIQELDNCIVELDDEN